MHRSRAPRLRRLRQQRRTRGRSLLSSLRSRIAAVAAIFLAALAATSALPGCSAPHKKGNEPELEGMVLVPAGEFLMGRESPDSASDEAPEHRVWLDAYYIDRTEVTNAQFKAFCDATQRLYPNTPMWDTEYFQKPEYPVINITYDQARAYCAWAGKRLPTEAEWEKAARGTDGRLYPWGNE